MKQGSSCVIIIFLFAILLAACSGGGGEIVPGPPVTLTSIAVTPVDPVIAHGTTTRLTAIGTYSNNRKLYITSSVAWDSSNPGIATISSSPGSQGLVTAASTTGSTIITATLSGITGSTTLITSDVASMNVAPPAPPSIAPGTTMQFIAIGTLSDSNSTQQNLTTWATWTSMNPGVADVGDASSSRGLTTAHSAGTSTITATYDGQSGMALFSSSTLTSIKVTPPSASIANGTTQQFTAIGTLSDNAQQNLTTWATWTSLDPGVATISNAAGSQGLATAVSEGKTNIAAKFSNITSSPTATLTVTPAILTSITVTPASPSIVLGTTQKFIAIGTFTAPPTQDISSSVTWNSSNTNVAAISNILGSKGLATSVDTGSTTITASSGGFSGSTILTVTKAVLVSIEINPASANISIGTTQQYSATGHFSDNSTQDLTTSVTWNSSDTAIATISNVQGFQGMATASFFTIGSTNISATFLGINSKPATLTVHL